ncbi:MAG: pseudouridylate synthase [Bacteroidales bacterium]|nr:pseudouridylate synthase [Bacteroidales bacterium]
MNPQDIDIRTLLPQQPPVVMVDRLVVADMITAETSLLVRPDNIFVEHGMLKAYALIENMAQTCAAQLGYVDKYIHGHDGVRIGYIGSIKNLKVESLPRVGETLRTRITVLQDILDMKLVTAESFVGERLIASAEMKIALSGERIDV